MGYEVDFLSLPGASGYEEDIEPSMFSIDLLGSDYENQDNRHWFDVDLFNEPVSASDEEGDTEGLEEEETEDSGFEEAEEEEELVQEEVEAEEQDAAADVEEEQVEEEETAEEELAEE